MTDAPHVVFLSVATLRCGDIDPETTPTLFQWASDGVLAELTPTFPCVTSCVQASMWTGAGPREHGVIANGLYDRQRREVRFWVARNGIIQGNQVWDDVRRAGLTSAAWHVQNIKDAGADTIVTPAPIHHEDGTTELSCYSKPDGLYRDLVAEFGHFPLHHYWGPMSGIASTRWILDAASRVHQRCRPNLHWIYLPHTDYAAQKHGPNSPEARSALVELDQEIGRFVERLARSNTAPVTYVVAGEYAMTDVSGAIHPNRLLREAGLISLDMSDGTEHLDLGGSAAFAMVDHQLAHVYVSDAGAARDVAALFRRIDGVAGVFAGEERRDIGIDHARSGDVVLVADDSHWFAYYWWLDDAAAPPFARTVDIHAKPGYDPVELFVESGSRSIPLDASLVLGSHGVPATGPQRRAALICSNPIAGVHDEGSYCDTDLKRILLSYLGLDTP